MKNKKLTNKQLENYIGAVDNKYNHAVEVVGKTLTDLIEFLGKKDDFIEFLSKKYKAKESRPEEDRKDSKETKEVYH